MLTYFNFIKKRKRSIRSAFVFVSVSFLLFFRGLEFLGLYGVVEGEVFVRVGDIDPPVVVAPLGVAGFFGKLTEPPLLVAQLVAFPFFFADQAGSAFGEVGVGVPGVDEG